MARKLKADDPIRLPDGSVVTVRQAVERGIAQVRRAWMLWQNETHGNIVGLSPRWRNCRQLYKTEPDAAVRRVYDRGFQFREMWLLDAADGSVDWGEVTRRDARTLAIAAGDADPAPDEAPIHGRTRCCA